MHRVRLKHVAIVPWVGEPDEGREAITVDAPSLRMITNALRKARDANEMPHEHAVYNGMIDWLEDALAYVEGQSRREAAEAREMRRKLAETTLEQAKKGARRAP